MITATLVKMTETLTDRKTAGDHALTFKRDIGQFERRRSPERSTTIKIDALIGLHLFVHVLGISPFFTALNRGSAV